ncbi:MAG: tetratricopeptide repeat protein [Magnetococcales bacterium]|nr:tetratricopeptide repeat protein [Magnetococcales bacterium]
MKAIKKNAPRKRSSPAPSIATGLEQALLAHQQGRWQEAVQCYQQVLSRQPRHQAALTNLASLYSRQADYPAALACYQKALQVGEVAPELWFNYGNLQQKMGMLDEAVTSFRSALRSRPNLHPAHYNLANLLRDRGETAQAILHYQTAIRLHPSFLMAYRNLGNLFRQLGQHAQAIEQHQLALNLAGQTEQQRAEGHYNLANSLADDQQSAAAGYHYQAALALAPNMVAALQNLGNLRQREGETAAAEACYQAVLRQAPGEVDSHLNLIRFYNSQNRPEAADALLAEALRQFPDHCELLRLQGDRLYQQEDATAALVVYQRIESLQPGLAQTANAMGVAYRALGQTEAAEQAWQRCLRIDPHHVVALTNLGTLYRLKKRHGEALAALRLAVSLQPDDGDGVASLACTLIDVGSITEALQIIEPVLAGQPDHVDLLGMKAFALVQQARIEEAQALLAKARQLKPDSFVAIGNTLFSSLYRDGWDGMAQSRLHRELAAQVSRLVKPLPPRRTALSSRVRRRIGYISPDFRTHPVGLFIEPVLRHHRADRFHVTCYALPHAPDETTQRLRSYAHQWREFEGWSLERMAARIQQDEIDILVDLAGYTAGGRMDLMACRPAPVQVIFLGYPYSTGLATMDYLLADPHLIPPQQEHLYTERVVRLPESFLCYQRQDAPAVAPLPALRNGFVTFGSYNNLPKVSAACLDLWARVLRAVPQSRLALKASSLGDEGTCALFRRQMEARGIGASRLLLMPGSPPEQYLAAFGMVDIALDPIPFNGGTTSCDTCWMGVPLVTLAGESFMGRMGTSLLTTLGRPEWIAADGDDYVRIAVELAADLMRLAEIRACLRPQMQASGLCDAVGYTAHLEKLYEGMVAAGDPGPTG